MSEMFVNYEFATWRHVVNLRIGPGPVETIRGPGEALGYLNGRWPEKAGPYMDAARRKCLWALENRTASEEAREVFMAAAIEARLLA